MAALGGASNLHPTSLLLTEGCVKRGHGHRRLPARALPTAGCLLRESGSTEPLGVEEDTCLHFHRFDVGLLLFFACGEGRTKGLSAELREWLRGPTLRLGCLLWGQESSSR